MVTTRSLRPALLLSAFPLVLAAQDTDPPGRAGRVASVAGTVAFQASGTPDWTVTPLNYTVTSGDRLLTSRSSRAEVEVGPFDVRLADSTDLTVVQLTDDFAQLGLTRGTLRVSVHRLATRDSMEVDTPNGAIIIRSAGRYRVDVLEGVSTIVTVEDGVVELSGPSLDYTVRRGQSVELTGQAAISANMVPHPRNTDFDSWSADRDRRQESASFRYVSRDIPGVADLDHHGHWHYHATYGYVWQPRIVNVGWVPYRHGRWVWSGPWGWTWVEDSPWGYAPFHYGRWVRVGGVWAWAPGPIVRRPYYAPALVVFIGGPRYGRHHQAWFPLGWYEPYYPRYRHSDRYLRQVNISNVRNVTNVDAFVDPRRADRIDYKNRQATTVVSTDVFGRRPVVHQAVNTGSTETARDPILRDRWETPRRETPRRATPTSATTQPAGDRQSTFRQRREASAPQEVREPVRTEPEARPRSPLIFRNSPPLDRRRAAPTDAPDRRADVPDRRADVPDRRADVPDRRAETPDRRPVGEARSRLPLERSGSTPIDDRPTIRRSTPSESPPSRPEAQPRRTIERSAQPSARSAPRASSSPPRSAPPRVSAPSGSRTASRRSGPPEG